MKRAIHGLLIPLLLIPCSLFADSCPVILEKPEEVKKRGEMRRKALKGWDSLLTWTLSPKNQDYELQVPPNIKTFRMRSKDIKNFIENYGHFSIYNPIVGLVTDSDRDRAASFCLLEAIYEARMNKMQRDFSIEEALAKVIAYRSIKKGMKIPMMIDRRSNPYIVDEVIDLWHGMPAFGLIPLKGNAPPILLFRGTDLFPSAKGWASILSDLDTSGPGYTTFLRGQKKIVTWLKKVKKSHRPARLIGFSLGGAFVLYTLAHHYDLVNKDEEFPSVAFNTPGVPESVVKKWNEIPKDLRPIHYTYVNQGDFVSQIGMFLSNVWLLTLPEPMGVIESHLTFISGQPRYQMSLVDVEAENKKRE